MIPVIFCTFGFKYAPRPPSQSGNWPPGYGKLKVQTSPRINMYSHDKLLTEGQRVLCHISSSSSPAASVHFPAEEEGRCAKSAKDDHGFGLGVKRTAEGERREAIPSALAKLKRTGRHILRSG